MLVGKSAPFKEQLEVRKEKGVKCIELHLPTLDFDVDDYISAVVASGLRVIHVHSPFVNDVSLSDIENYKYQGALLGSCEIAQYFAEKQGERVGVVLHAPVNVSEPVNVELIRKILKVFAKMHPDVYFLIENMTPINIHNGVEIRRQGYDMANVALCKELNMPNTVYTLLDTCHIYMTLKEQVQGTNLQSLTEYICANKDYLKGMHISECIGRGLNIDTHGAVLTDKNKLDELVVALKEFDLDIPLVIETNEKDLLNPINLELGWNALQEAGNFAGYCLPCA